jgi:hypothetical protein
MQRLTAYHTKLKFSNFVLVAGIYNLSIGLHSLGTIPIFKNARREAVVRGVPRLLSQARVLFSKTYFAQMTSN